MIKFRLIIASLAFCLVGCVAIRPSPPPKSSPEAKVGMSVVRAQLNRSGFEIRLKFFEWTDHDGIIQEIDLIDREGNIVTTLVEYFDTPNGVFGESKFDRHWTSTHSGYQRRRMRLYPATVEGMDLSAIGFGHLPQNRDGSKVTNIGPNFNEKHQEKYETHGKVVSDDRDNSIFWSIDYLSPIITITLPDRSTIVLGKVIGNSKEASNGAGTRRKDKPKGIRQEPPRVGKEERAKTQASAQTTA